MSVTEEEIYARRTYVLYDKATDKSGLKKVERMGTGVRDTSREAYKNHVLPKLGDNQQQVYDTIKGAKRPVCDQEIGKHLGWTINNITNRRGELVKMGKVKEAFKAVNPATGKRVIYWKAV